MAWNDYLFDVMNFNWSGDWDGNIESLILPLSLRFISEQADNWPNEYRVALSELELSDSQFSEAADDPYFKISFHKNKLNVITWKQNLNQVHSKRTGENSSCRVGIFSHRVSTKRSSWSSVGSKFRPSEITGLYLILRFGY